MFLFVPSSVFTPRAVCVSLSLTSGLLLVFLPPLVISCCTLRVLFSLCPCVRSPVYNCGFLAESSMNVSSVHPFFCTLLSSHLFLHFS